MMARRREFSNRIGTLVYWTVQYLRVGEVDQAVVTKNLAAILYFSRLSEYSSFTQTMIVQLQHFTVNSKSVPVGKQEWY